MPEPILSVAFFCTAAGNEPVRAFLKELTVEDRKAVGTDIKTVQFGMAAGHAPGAQDGARPVGSAQHHRRRHRSRPVTVRQQQMVLLHASVKKDQKTPLGELKTAQSRLRQLQE